MEWSRRVLIILVIILIIDLTSFTCILPLFPSIFDHYANAQRHEKTADRFFEYFESGVRSFQGLLRIPDTQRYNNVFFAGILGSMFSLLQYLSSPFLGALSDVYGRKPILLSSIFGSLLSYCLWNWSADSFGLFVASRALGGLSKASVSVSIALVADLFAAHERAHGMAFVGVSFSIAFIFGPMIGAYFAVSGKSAAAKLGATFSASDAPAKFAIGSTVVELLLVTVFLPETLKKPKLKFSQIFNSVWDYVLPSRLFNFAVLDEKRRSSSPPLALTQMRAYSSLYFVYLFVYSALEFTLCFLTHIRFNYDGIQQGRLYFFSGILMILIQGGLIRKIPLHGQRRALRVGLLAVVPAFVLVALAHNEFTLYAGLSLYATASALVVPCVTTLISARCDDAVKGSCLGVFRSVGALARACGPIFGSFLFWLLGATYCYLIGAVLLIVPVLMLNRIDDDTVDKRKAHVD